MSRVRSARRSPEKREYPKIDAAERSKAQQQSWYFWLCVLLLFVVNWIAYSNSFQTGWHFDDGPNIVGNPDIFISDLSWKSLGQAASSQPGGKRPVSYLSFALNYYFFGEDPFSFHVVNFLIHWLNAVLVFQIFSVLIARATRRSAVDARLLSGLAAALWSVNPVQTQPVVYVVQRMTLLSSFFSLLSFYFFVQW